MWELLIFRNLEERDRATVVERCRVSPPLPSPLFVPHRTLLGYAVNTGSRNTKEGPRDLRDVTRNDTQRCVLRMSDSSVYKRDNRRLSLCTYVLWYCARIPRFLFPSGFQINISHRPKFVYSTILMYRSNSKIMQ
jgi:hypothetical protein